MNKFLMVLLVFACGQASFGQLSGSLSGSLGPGTFTVIGNIQVDADSVLQLAPGTTFNFQDAYRFRVYGRLIAEGTEESLIVFTTDQSGNNRWKGIRFDGAASSGSRLSYCLIEKGYARNGGGNLNSGGGVGCFKGAPSFTHCTFRYCRASEGGGVYISYEIPYYTEASPSFTDCAFIADSALSMAGWGLGGGVACMDSANFTNCRFDSNVAGFGAGAGAGYSCFTNCTFTANTGEDGVGAFNLGSTFIHCTFSRNQSTTRGYGGGVNDDDGRFTDCVFSGNFAQDAGGGVSCGSSSTFINCIIIGNSTSYDGGGVSCSGSPTFRNCVISGNSAPRNGGGVYCYENSSVTFNSTIISFSTGAGICFSGNSPGSQFAYCDIFGNSGGNIANPAGGPPGIGQLVTTNANGDSCDIYDNIFLDPLFADTAASNFHLTDLSHCIGAADPTNPPSTDFDGDPRPDPPGSNPDIGMDEHPFGAPGVPPPVTDLVISIAGARNGNAVLNWSPVGSETYTIYGGTEPFILGILLENVADTTWTDINTSGRPSPYFYYVTATSP